MKSYIAFSLLCLFFIIQACPLAPSNQTVDSSSAEVNYRKYCADCHGKYLEEFVDRTWLYGNSQEAVFSSIKYGNDEDGMPAYDTTFTDEEIYELTDFILNDAVRIAQNKPENATLSDLIQSEDLAFRLDTLVRGLDIPWGLELLPNGDVLITERSGKLLLWTANKGKGQTVDDLQEISGLPAIKAKGQGGLLDIKLHPNYAENAWLYLSFSKPSFTNSRASTTAVIRAKLDNYQLVNLTEIFVAEPYVTSSHHFGSRLEFDEQGYLYVSVGDRGRRDDYPQTLDNQCGKIHRIKDDGTIPSDNPFVNHPTASPSIWSYGHRNPQGLARHPQTGDIWEHEHGPRGGDEINRIEKALNYGWPIISYGINYSGTRFTKITEKEGMEQPILHWTPSIAPCGMDFVNHEKYGAWNGDILSGSLKFEYVNRSVMDGNKVIREEKILEGIGRVRVIKMGTDGYIYIGVEAPGAIYKLLPDT